MHIKIGFFSVFIFFFSSFLFTQELKTTNKEQNIGAKLTYVPVNSELKKAGLEVSDFIISYAGFSISDEKKLIKIEQFLVQLETRWAREGKNKNFWEDKADWIKKKTRGIVVNPVAFSETGEPLYKVTFKRENQNKFITQNTHLKAKQFLFVFQEKKQKNLAGHHRFKGWAKAYKNRVKRIVNESFLFLLGSQN